MSQEDSERSELRESKDREKTLLLDQINCLNLEGNKHKLA